MADTQEIIARLATPRDMIRWATSRLDEAGLFFGHGTDNALDEAAGLVLQTLHLPMDLDPLYMEARLLPAEVEKITQVIARRIDQRKPAAYLTGKAWFAGLQFHVDERVIVPRSPIAEMIGEHFAPWVSRPPRRILDLCTGSGCIAVACAMAFPDAQVDATDISSEALDVAQINVERHHLSDRIELLAGDLFAATGGHRYDLIISNPPYVHPLEYASLPTEFLHEPKIALRAEDNGLAIANRIIEEAASHLHPGGTLIVEVGGTARSLAAHWPDLPFTWPHFENGGDGVFVLARDQLPGAALLESG